MLQIKLMCISCETALRWMPQKTFDDKAPGNGLSQSPEPVLTQCDHITSLGHSELT